MLPPLKRAGNELLRGRLRLSPGTLELAERDVVAANSSAPIASRSNSEGPREFVSHIEENKPDYSATADFVMDRVQEGRVLRGNIGIARLDTVAVGVLPDYIFKAI